MKTSKIFIAASALILAVGGLLSASKSRTEHEVYFETVNGFKGSYITENYVPCVTGSLGCVMPIPGTNFDAQLYSTHNLTAEHAYGIDDP